MITKDMLAQLRAQRLKPHANLDYTIDGAIHTEVVSQLDSTREKEISKGEKTLRNALEDFRREQAFSTRNGLAKAQFNHQEEIKP